MVDHLARNSIQIFFKPHLIKDMMDNVSQGTLFLKNKTHDGHDFTAFDHRSWSIEGNNNENNYKKGDHPVDRVTSNNYDIQKSMHPFRT